MIYNIDFDIAAIVVLIFVIFFLFNKKGLGRGNNRVYLTMVIFLLFSAVTDIFSSIVNSHGTEYSLWEQDMWNYAYLSIYNTLPLLFLIYSIQVLHLTKRMKVWHWALVLLPVIAVYSLLLLNPFLHCAFYYTGDRIYTHGAAFLPIYFSAYIYMTAVIVLALRFRRLLSYDKRISLVIMVLTSTVPVVWQMLHPEVLISIFFQSLGFLGILFAIENKDEIMSPVSGTYNRYRFLDELNEMVCHETDALVIVKISDIGYYNSTIGIHYVNELLRSVASWLMHVRTGTMLYDCGNGHFALLCKRGNIGLLKKVIQERFHESWRCEELELVFPVQISSIDFGDENKESIEDVLLIIDQPFDSNETEIMDATEALKKYRRRILVERLIRKALKNRSFQVWYQPIWDRKSGVIHSAEALIRLIDDEYGFISPEEFIPIAEQNGTVIEIGAFVFEEVCRFYKERNLEDYGVEYVEVNLSVVQCMSRKLVESFDAVMKRYRLDASHINLEITESATAGSLKALLTTVNELESRGFSFSLDDYGTGYSNISYIHDLPFSIIKLDKSILWSAVSPDDATGGENAMILLQNTMRMMHEMNYKTLVEGVETVEQKLVLEELGCDYFQGYYFSKPVPGDSFIDFIKVVNSNDRLEVAGS